MTRSNIFLLGLALVQIVLIILTGGDDVTIETHKEEMGREPFAGLQVSAVARIEITDDDLRTVVLERKEQPEKEKESEEDQSKDEDASEEKEEEGRWVLANLGGFPAKSGEAERAIRAIAKVRLMRVLTRRKKNFTALEVSDARFARHVVVKGEDGRVLADFYIGDSDRPNTVRFREAGKEVAYEASGIDTWDFNADPTSWVETSFTDFEKQDIVRVRLENENGTFEIALEEKQKPAAEGGEKAAAGEDEAAASRPAGQEGGKKDAAEGEAAEKVWVVVEPAPRAGTVLDKDDVEIWLGSFCSLYLADPIGPDETKAEYGFEKPTARVVLTMKDGQAHEIVIGAFREEDKDYYARRSGFDYVVTLREWSVNGPFKKKLDDLLPKEEDQQEDK